MSLLRTARYSNSSIRSYHHPSSNLRTNTTTISARLQSISTFHQTRLQPSVLRTSYSNTPLFSSTFSPSIPSRTYVTMSSEKKTIVVFGATGNQGGSVISALLAHPDLAAQYAIKGVTRDPTKPSAAALKAKGVEPIKADLSDPSSLVEAVKGAYAVFAVTNYWDTVSKSAEITQGKNIVDASISTGVKHLVWSSLPNTHTLSNGVLSHIEHFDSKAEVSVYAEAEKSKSGLWVTHFMPGYFMQNLKSAVRKNPQTGALGLAIPWNETQTQVPMLDIKVDTGKYVAGALVLGAEADGKFIQGVSTWGTPADIIRAISEEANTKVTFTELPQQVWQGFLPMPENIQIELGENMTLIRDYSYYGKGAPAKQAESHKFIEAIPGQKLVTLPEFVKAYAPWE